MRETCANVKSQWVEECNLRVDLIDQTRAGQVEEAAVTQLKLDNLYDDLEVVVIEKNLDELPSTRIKNPYRFNSGDYDLTETEIRQVKAAMDAKYSAVEKRALLTGWYGAKRGRLRKGFRTNNDMNLVKAYFNDLVAENNRVLSQRRSQVAATDTAELEAMAQQKATFDSNANGEYKWVLSGNSRKTNALRELARVSCQLGGSGW